MAGYRVRAGRIGLGVDNFLMVFFFNDFNTQSPKSLESSVFDHYEFLRTLGFARDQFKLQWLS